MNKKIIILTVAAAAVLIIFLVLIVQQGQEFKNEVLIPEYETLEEEFNVVKEEKIAELMAVAPYQGSGIATKSFADGVFLHTVVADIADPAPGKFYEGWLVDKQPVLRFFSTGRLEKQGEQYMLSFTANQDYPDYNDVVITEETEALGLDGIPEDHVLDGSFHE